ncbi:MAG: phosphoribosylformylglycinamidine cyclo-ligase [Gemmatimonadota bacterium]
MERGLTYRDAGVDLEAATRAKTRLRELVESTRTAAVTSRFGSFGGRFRADGGRELVASADGVGTKLKVAVRAGRHDTVGIDLVNHCVNDILAEGARPLVFLDYIATGALDPDVVVAVVSGLAAACRETGCALIGGETAEMPDFYAPGEYDLAGFIVGELVYPAVARREARAGDWLLGLASNGLHTNGYSFARRLIFDRLGMDVDDVVPGTGETVAEALLRPHRSYLGVLEESLAAERIRALAHVTGGGIPGNLDRVLPDDLAAVVDTTAWTPGPLFRFLQEESGAAHEEMFRTFNMGVGMVAVVGPDEQATVRESIARRGCDAFPCGEIVPGDGSVRLA